MTYMGPDSYIFELEDIITKLLEKFDPEAGGYVVYNDDGEPFMVGEELTELIDHAHEVMYTEGVEDDD